MQAKRKIQWTNTADVADFIARGYSPVTAKTMSFIETMEGREPTGLRSLGNYLVNCSCGESRHFHVADSCRSFCQTHAFQKVGHDVRVRYIGATRS